MTAENREPPVEAAPTMPDAEAWLARRRYARQLQWLRANLPRALTHARRSRLPDTARARIRARLTRERDADP